VKIELFPEDMLLEFARGRLRVEANPAVKGMVHLEHLPAQIEFSEEFPQKWQKIVEPAVKRFIASTFGLRKFLFDVDGYTKRFSAADPQFWENVDLKFSQRAAERLYEQMVFPVHKIEPLYHLVLPADAILVSIFQWNFTRFSFAWLLKNSASWLVKAVFISWQAGSMTELPWQHLLEYPEKVELPLRDYLVEKTAEYLAFCSTLLRQRLKVTEVLPGYYDPELVGGVRSHFLDSARFTENTFNYINRMIKSTRNAVAYWTGEGTVNIDDEKFVAGSLKTFGFEHEAAIFERLLGMYIDTVDTREAIHESILRDQTTA